MCIYGHRLFIIATIIDIEHNCFLADTLINFQQQCHNTFPSSSFLLSAVAFPFLLPQSFCHLHNCTVKVVTFTLIFFQDLFSCLSFIFLSLLISFFIVFITLNQSSCPTDRTTYLWSSFPQLHGFQLAAHCQHTSSHLKLKCLCKLLV